MDTIEAKFPTNVVVVVKVVSKSNMVSDRNLVGVILDASKYKVKDEIRQPIQVKSNNE